MTAGAQPLGLVPKAGAKSGEIAHLANARSRTAR